MNNNRNLHLALINYINNPNQNKANALIRALNKRISTNGNGNGNRNRNRNGNGNGNRLIEVTNNNGRTYYKSSNSNNLYSRVNGNTYVKKNTTNGYTWDGTKFSSTGNKYKLNTNGRYTRTNNGNEAIVVPPAPNNRNSNKWSRNANNQPWKRRNASGINVYKSNKNNSKEYTKNGEFYYNSNGVKYTWNINKFVKKINNKNNLINLTVPVSNNRPPRSVLIGQSNGPILKNGKYMTPYRDNNRMFNRNEKTGLYINSNGHLYTWEGINNGFVKKYNKRNNGKYQSITNGTIYNNKNKLPILLI